jgi:hypothetical protein
MGEMAKAKVLYDDLKERSTKEYVTFTMIAMSAAYLGYLDESFEYLEKGYEARDPVLMTIKYEHWVPAILKAHPRFQQFLDKIGFP